MNNDESSPLLGEAGTPSDMAVKPAPSGSLIKTNLFGTVTVLIAQFALLLFGITIWQLIGRHPAGLFSWHPALQSVAVLLFIEGILILQPTNTASTKRTGLALHQVFQLIALPIIVSGTAIIMYNKTLHNAAHFTTWHGKFGLLTLVMIIVQSAFGAAVVYAQTLFGGADKAKRLWKYHRVSGYVLVALFFITPALAIDYSDWMMGNSSKSERVILTITLGLTILGVLARVKTSKLGLR